MMKFKLYSSDGCHLCELALALCEQVISANDIAIIDIVDDEKMVEQYGVHIPVLQRLSDDKELFWPFDLAQLSAYVKELT